MRSVWPSIMSALAVASIAGFVSVASSATPMSEVELRITDHKPGIADFKRLAVGLKTLSLHKKGSPRTQGWVELASETPPVDIVPLKDGRYQVIGTVRVPASVYDALRIRFSEPTGELHSGGLPAMAAQDTTIAAAVTLRNAVRTSILIDLYAENQTDHTPKSYVVKVKDVRIGE